MSKGIKLKYIKTHFLKPKEEWSSKESVYLWDELKKSIKKNGILQPIKLQHIDKKYLDSNKPYKYKVVNGHHRIKILLDLYGKEYVLNKKCFIWKQEHIKVY